MRSRRSRALGLALCLAGVAPAANAQDAESLKQDAYALAFDIALASRLAVGCPALDYDRQHGQRLWGDMQRGILAALPEDEADALRRLVQRTGMANGNAEAKLHLSRTYALNAYSNPAPEEGPAYCEAAAAELAARPGLEALLVPSD